MQIRYSDKVDIRTEIPDSLTVQKSINAFYFVYRKCI
jgi:hypothetical protein